MENIFIRDEANTFKNLISNNEESENTTIIAKKGFIENKKLVLIDGLIQTQNNEGEINNINFKQTELVSSLLTPRIIRVPKLQETSTWSLINCITRSDNLVKEKIINCPSDGIKKGATETVSRRIGMPMYIPLTTLICCFLIVSRKETKINFFGKYIFFFIGFLILVLAEILVRYSGFSDLNTLIYFLFPIIFTPLTYLLLINRLKYEKASV